MICFIKMVEVDICQRHTRGGYVPNGVVSDTFLAHRCSRSQQDVGFAICSACAVWKLSSRQCSQVISRTGSTRHLDDAIFESLSHDKSMLRLKVHPDCIVARIIAVQCST